MSYYQALEQPILLSNKGVIDFTITPSAHYQAWKTQKDKTAIEPNALSNSHYICTVYDQTLNEVDCMMRLVPLESTFIPRSWCYKTDVEILKQSGLINSEDMRLIQLIHLEY